MLAPSGPGQQLGWLQRFHACRSRIEPQHLSARIPTSLLRRSRNRRGGAHGAAVEALELG